MENHTEVTEFILIGFKDQPKVRISLFFLFLVIYIITLGGNMGMIIITTVDVQLHSPMYFFLKNLSFLDICYSSVITPKAMLDFITGNKIISYSGCAAQMFFFSLFGTTEAFFLAIMAYDRFIAICSPLLYHIIMSQKRCVCLLSISYFFGFINCCIQTGFTFSLSFCDSLIIDHFFCDVPAIMKISCSVTFVNELVLLSVCGFIIVTTAVVVIVSYVYIISTIINIPSVKGKQKAFSTCTSHLMAVSLFFGTVFFMYAQPGALSSPNQGKVVSLFYTVVIPMLNPIIYSLRNREVKEALNRQLRKIDT
ncbi:olfactory receptor 12-like [Crotalus tigris]|uniref:olfactory receptor 12-like n=1 Tax=Crotalus tigris TaxID=88082 RepID=UPI00192F5807|nr:olfactory receptor 12-like [Crotalus tigris]XP_039225330.1 olfactory receptor 12-like [Crotalus tigris]